MYKFLVILCFVLGQSPFSAQSINENQLQKLLLFCDSTKADEILLSHKGKIISHWQRTDFSSISPELRSNDCYTPYMYTASMVKSWVGLLIGILIDKKLINHVEDPVCYYLPGWQEGCKNRISIKHLLTMSAGLTRLGPAGVLNKADMNEFVLNLKPQGPPGTKFSYSNESVQLLGLIIESVTKLKADAAFEKYLINPLKMDSTSFSKDSMGNVILFGGCKTTVFNAHKIGQLMLDRAILKDRGSSPRSGLRRRQRQAQRLLTTDICGG